MQTILKCLVVLLILAMFVITDPVWAGICLIAAAGTCLVGLVHSCIELVRECRSKGREG